MMISPIVDKKLILWQIVLLPGIKSGFLNYMGSRLFVL